MLGQINMSILVVAEKLSMKPAPEALDAQFAMHFPGFRLDPDLREAILKQQPLERNYTHITTSALSRIVSRQTGIYLGTSGNTTEPVVVGAIGRGAELFRGNEDNTNFGKHLHRLISSR